MTFRFSTPKFDSIELDKQGFQTVSIRALRAVGKQARTQAAKSIYERYNLPYGEISGAISVGVESPSARLITINAKGKMLPLINFVKGRTSEGVRTVRYFVEGVRVEIVRGQQKYLPHAFFAKMPSGHVGVFERIGGTGWSKGRPKTSSPNLPIKELKVISVADMFRAKVVMEQIRTFITNNFERLLNHEIEYYLSNGR